MGKQFTAFTACVVALLASSCLPENKMQNFYSEGLKDVQDRKYDEAIELFKKSLQQNPEDPTARFGLAWAYQLKGAKDNALVEYQKAVNFGGDNLHRAYFNLGVLLTDKKNFAEAAQAYQSALLLSPKSAPAAYNLAFVYQELGQLPKAIEYFVKANELEPKNASALYFAGQLCERLSRPKDAIRYYKAALVSLPTLSVASERLRILKAAVD